MAQRDLIPVVEAAYALDGDDNAWLTSLCRAALPVLDRKLGVAAILYDARREDYVEILGMGGVEVRPEVFGAMFNLPEMPDAERRQLVQGFRTRSSATARGMLWRGMPATQEIIEQSLSAVGLPEADAVCVNAADPSHRGCLLVSFSPRPVGAVSRVGAQWSQAAAHISSAWRMRRRLRTLQTTLLTELPETEAIFNPAGKAEHATGVAKATNSLEKLRAAVVALERARRISAHHPNEALAIREALVDGRWSLLDCFERAGRRYWVAHPNEPDVPEVRTLTEREQQVAAYAALGQSNKLISYELGLSRSSVAAALRSARAKLGARTRVALVRALSAERRDQS